MKTPEELEHWASHLLVSLHDPRRIALLRLILAEYINFPAWQHIYHHIIKTYINIASYFISSLIPGLVDRGLTAHTHLGCFLAFVLAEQIVPGSASPIYSPPRRSFTKFLHSCSLESYGRLTLHEQALAFVDEPTYRVWRLFMSGSAYGFTAGRLNVYQALLIKQDKSGHSGIPLTRADWYLNDQIC